jgi:aspartokinase
MPLPNKPVTLAVSQIHELNQKLADLRHDVNNSLSLMSAAIELIKRRPETAARMWGALAEQPRKVAEHIAKFSQELESALQITQL